MALIYVALVVLTKKKKGFTAIIDYNCILSHMVNYTLVSVKFSFLMTLKHMDGFSSNLASTTFVQNYDFEYDRIH